MVAPESDDNPWHYKISWNPRNVVMAGKAGATFLEDGEVAKLDYTNLFSTRNLVELPDGETLAFYPNRDSLSYIETYGLQGVQTFIRTTLRHPEFCLGWKSMVDLKLTDEEKNYNSDKLTVSQIIKKHYKKNGYDLWLLNLVQDPTISFEYLKKKFIQNYEDEQANEKGEPSQFKNVVVDAKGNMQEVDKEISDDPEEVYAKKHFANVNKRLTQLLYLDLTTDETILKKGLCSAADVLQFLLEKKLALSNKDKDMIVMLHEFDYELNSKNNTIKSLLKVIGDDNIHTAMAKTVGLPLGIAAKLILEGKIKETGLHIPILPSIYEPVMKELEKYGVVFEESTPNP